jgi:hypothetical protein
MKLAEHLKFGSSGESATHSYAFRLRAREYARSIFEDVGREMILS